MIEQDDKYFDLVDSYLTKQGIDDPDIRMELSDHICEWLDHQQIEDEFIPADILSRVDDHFDHSRFDTVYKELLSMKIKSGRGFMNHILINYSITSAIILTILHRIVFFVLLPMIPVDVYLPFQPLAIAFTGVFYLSMALFFLLKAVRMARA